MKKNLYNIRFLILIVSLLGFMISLTGCSIGGIALGSGRPLRSQGESVVTKLSPANGASYWAQGQRPDISNLDELTRVALAQLWLQDALGEHASIPAFARISWQLAAIGAPPELLEWAHRAALEEIGHARLCFALAEGYGQAYFVQPTPKMLQGAADLAQEKDLIKTITNETIFDGCLLEGFFAKVALSAVVQCEEPAVLAALEKISSEEKSHATFSWAILNWLLKQDPLRVKTFIREACDDLATYDRPNAVNNQLRPLVKLANAELLVKHGRLPDEQWQKIWDEHLKETIQELQQLL